MTAQLATIQSRTDLAENRQAVSTQALVFDPQTIQSMMQMADMMAQAAVTVPKHLAGKPADCLAVIMQAAQFQMNPFALAQKTHLVNGTLGYEAQLVNAVVCNSGAIQGRFHYEYRGEGANIECRVGAVIAGEREITWGEWLSAASVTAKNSPLWKTNPKQQLGYLQVKNWARQYAPGAILGVYSSDELEQREPRAMGTAEVITDDQPAPASRAASVKAKLTAKREQQSTETLDAVLAAIAAADTLAALAAITDRAAKLSGDDKSAARAAWTDRKRALEAAEQPAETAEPDDTLNLTAILAGIEAAKDAADVEEWQGAARDADLTDAERQQVQAAADARRAKLTG